MYFYWGGLRKGASVAKWSQSLSRITCPSLPWVLIPPGTWILSCDEAIQLACGTSVVQSEIIHGEVPEVFLHQ